MHLAYGKQEQRNYILLGVEVSVRGTEEGTLNKGVQYFRKYFIHLESTPFRWDVTNKQAI